MNFIWGVFAKLNRANIKERFDLGVRKKIPRIKW